MKSDKKSILELRRIAANHKGILRPEDVIDCARDKKSPLHNKFEWDDSAAAQSYRIWQARQLISVSVEYIKVNNKEMPVRVFVSLSPDRLEKGGGYRCVNTVMTDESMREQMFSDAKADMVFFTDKYKILNELSKVFKEMKKIINKK
jgi:hypothetical protein